MKARYVGASLALAVVTLTACGGSDDDSSASASGDDPIKVMVIGGFESESMNQPQMVDGAEAAAKAINAKGGIAGRDLEVLNCNTREDENQAATCARDAVSEGVVAVVGSSTTKSNAVLPVLEQAGIASIPSFPITTEDYNSAVSFPISGGNLEYGGAATLVTEELGLKKLGFVIRDAVSAEGGLKIATTSLEASGGTAGKVARLSATGATDVAPQIESASQGADAIELIVSQAQTSLVLRQTEQSGLDIPIVSIGAGLPDAEIASLGEAAEGYLAAGSSPPVQSDDPSAVQFREEMKANGSEDVVDDNSMLSWTTVHLLAEVAGGLDEITADSVLEAMGSLDNFDFLWLKGYTTTKDAGLEGYSRLFNQRVYFSEIQDGVKTLLRPDPVPVAVS
jgi:ABC-type branched-subunit amino acid transport system substrate-binding protein